MSDPLPSWELEELQSRAAGGDSDAMYRLAQALSNEDPEASMSLLAQAAELGDWRAAYSLGNRVRFDKPDDTDAAKHWYDLALREAEKAANQGQTEAMVITAYLLRDSDPERSTSWYRKAAEEGHVDAMTQMAILLRDASPAEAFEWEERAISLGSGRAAYNRACHPLSSPAEARRYYQLAANLGNVAALDALGYLEDQNHNEEKAIEWWQQGADRGDAGSMTSLATKCRHRDRGQALRLAKQAAELGNLSAMRLLAVMLEPDDWDAATFWLRKAAALGDPRAIDLVSKMPDRQPALHAIGLRIGRWSLERTARKAAHTTGRERDPMSNGERGAPTSSDS